MIQLRKTLSSQTQGMTMTTMTTQLARAHQGHHQPYTDQGLDIILMKSMKCLLFPRKIVDWYITQETQHGSHLLISIQMQMLRIWKLL